MSPSSAELLRLERESGLSRFYFTLPLAASK